MSSKRKLDFLTLVNVQVLKLKPRETWSEESKRALKIGFPYHSESIDRVLSGRWVYVYFNGGVLDFAGAPVLDGHFYHEFLLRPTSERPDKAPAPQWFADKANLGFTAAIGQITETLRSSIIESGFYPTNDPISLKNSFSPTGLGSGFPLPLEIIDWESSVFSFSMSRSIPTASLVVKSHTIHFYASHLGNESVLNGGSSGRLQNATNRSGIATYGLNHWNSIPDRFKKVPETLEEMEEYLKWLESVSFKDSGRLSAPDENKVEIRQLTYKSE